MSWGLVAGAAVGLVGSAVQGSSASRAARGQRDAASAALEEQRRQYDLSREDQAPYRDAGRTALSTLSGFGDYNPTPTAASVMAEPGYQFGLQEGLGNVQNTAAARGGLYSGNALKALTRYGNDYATTKFGEAANRAETNFGNRWGRLASLAGIGQTATNQTQQAGQNYATNVGNIGMSSANAQGAAGIAQGNIWGNALNQAGSALGRMNWGGTSPSYGQSIDTSGTALPTGDFSRMDRGYADGGPVRREPKIGTRTPLPEGGGGGLSRESILKALRTPEAPVPKEGIAGLPADPTRNPRAIIMEREKKAGSYSKGGKVKGPGTARSDSIPARLSNGEHVVTAAEIKALGNGDQEAGHQNMKALRLLMKA